MHSSASLTIRLYVWYAVSAAVFALTETFSRIETAQSGAIAWGALLLALGVGHTILLILAKRPAGWGLWWVGHGLTAIMTGAITLALAGWDQLLLLTWSITVWALIAGVSTLVHAWRMPAQATRTDWFVVGGATTLLALVTLVVPTDVVATMGFAGVWGSIIAVFLGIGAVNVKMSTRQAKGE